MTREEIIADLEYARTLAEEGRQAPLLGGAYLIFWGALNLVAFVAHWALQTGLAPIMGGLAYALLWGGYTLIGVIGMALLGQRTRTQPGLTTIGVQAEHALWMGAVMALGVVALGSIARMLLEQNPLATNIILGAAFALYGAALYGTSKLSQQSWIGAVALLSLVIAGLACAFANQSWVYLLAAAGSVLVLIAPGIVLLKREPATLV